MTLQQLATDHPYYASTRNYYSNDAGEKFNSWAEFWAEWQSTDIDMNAPFRFDVRKREQQPGYSEMYYMELVIIQQRKGIYYPIVINHLTEEDVPQIIEYLKTGWEYMQSLWAPIATTTKAII